MEKTIPRKAKELRSTVNGNVAALMAARGFSKDQMAALIGMSRASLNNRLNGSNAWTCDDIAMIAKVAQCEPEQILRKIF